MEEGMSDHGEDDAVFYAALQRRTAQLHRMFSSGVRVPPTVVALVLKSVLMSGIGYCGAELRNWWLEWLDHRVREDHGLCQFCGRKKNLPSDTLCDTCRQSIEMEDKELRIHDDPEGGVM
jgi:hypothetical protein